MATAADLYALQKIDTLQAKVRHRLLKIQKQLGESDDLTTARQRVAATEAELHTWQAAQRDAELQSQSLKKRVAETDHLLMSGTVTNPKELQTLQDSLDALRRQRSGVEDAAMEALLQVEQFNDQLAELQDSLNTIEEDWRGAQGDLVAEETKMKRNFVILKRQREAAAATIDAASLADYERLRKRKGGIAVTKLENDMCGACYVQVPTGVVSAMRGGNELVVCPSCGRILYSS